MRYIVVKTHKDVIERKEKRRKSDEDLQTRMKMKIKDFEEGERKIMISN